MNSTTEVEKRSCIACGGGGISPFSEHECGNCAGRGYYYAPVRGLVNQKVRNVLRDAGDVPNAVHTAFYQLADEIEQLHREIEALS